MAELSFTPTFHHTDWVDNVDRVTAGGPNGFNVRLNAIEADLHQVSAVVSQIDTTIDQRRTGAQPRQHRVTLPLQLFSPKSGAAPALGWFYDNTGAVRPQEGHRGASAFMMLVLPDNAKLVSFRVQGRYPGGSAVFTYTMSRVLIADPTQGGLLGSVTSSVPGLTNPYDLTVAIDQQFAVVDNGAFRYVISFFANLFDQPVVHSVESLQIVYNTQ